MNLNESTRVLHVNRTSNIINRDAPRWGIFQRRLVIGTGPYRTYKRLMGTQIGIVFRADDGPKFLAYACSWGEIQVILTELKSKLRIEDQNKLGIIRNETNMIIPRPIIAKTHHHKQKRRKSLANQHLDWWKAPVGYFHGLESLNRATV